ncbi:MAG: Wzt carbohydrate-binding domain-containing protein, partial [Deltaproteobacteria bacterium]|nr:Wzt carbohydrate-binding domain-containing protein [Deltaproteobacteria bacterium]
LFVSHNTEAVVRHCDSAILLEGGRIIDRGEPKSVVNRYIDMLFSNNIDDPAPEPVVLEEGYRGFNIVHFGPRFYAISQELGSFDIGGASEDSINRLTGQDVCAVGLSHEDVLRAVDRMESRHKTIVEGKDGLERFFEEAPLSDNCPKRKSYNKNEYRHGDRRAEVIDYLVASGGVLDPVNVRSGTVVDIYMRVVFYEKVDHPMFGFAITTVDGVIVYGTNTRLCRIDIAPAAAGAVNMVKWSIRLSANSGDFFINLGVAEKRPDMDLLIDNRKDLIHIKVQTDGEFDGFARFETSFEEFPSIPAKSF